MNFEDAKKLLEFFRTDRRTAEQERQDAIHFRLQIRLISGPTPDRFANDWERICALRSVTTPTPEQFAELETLLQKHQAQMQAMRQEEEAAYDADQA